MHKRLISVSEKSKYLTISVNVYENLGATCTYSPQQLNTTGPMCVCVSEFECSLFLQITQSSRFQLYYANYYNYANCAAL